MEQDFEIAPSYLGSMGEKLNARDFGWIAVGAAIFGVLAIFFRRFGWAKFGFRSMVAAGEKWRDTRLAERVQALISRLD